MKLLISFFLLFCCVNVAVAEEAVKLSGFGTLAVTTTTSDKLGFRRNCYSDDVVYKDSFSLLADSVLGVQADVDFSSGWRGVLQLVAKDRVENSAMDFVNYAFLEYQPIANVIIRAGRIPLDVFMLSDYREVGFAYPWVRPTPEVYRTLFYEHYDGVDILFSRRIGSGVAEVKFNVDTLGALFPFDTVGEIEFSYKPIFGVDVRYILDYWRFIGSFQRGIIDDVPAELSAPQALFASFSQQFPAISSLANEASLEGTYADYFNAGFSYDDFAWKVQGEICRYSFEKALGLTYTSGYLSFGYSIGEWTPFIVLAKIKGNVERSLDNLPLAQFPPAMQMAATAIVKLIHDLYVSQRTFSFGARWDIYQNMALKLQWDYNDIEDGHSAFWEFKGDHLSHKDENVSIFTLALSFVF